ncbi:MAG: Bug family tripartite tricarboxylate transporter substrate binding protein [Burkholderiales bacterium]
MRTLLIIALALMPTMMHAQSAYPAKQVRIVVPQPAGGGYDTITRVFAAKLQDYWGQAVLVENRAGGNAIIGTDHVAKSAPDGYTLIMGGIGPHAINPALFPKLPYDAVRDFIPIVSVSAAPNLLVVTPSNTANSAKDLAALLRRAQPQPMSYGSNGVGSSTHLAAEMFLQMIGTKAVHVPYKGSAPMVTALLGNQVEVAFMNIIDILVHVNAGKVRALATAATRRSALLPDVPTIAEAGFPGAESSAWFGLFAPAGTPQDIVLKVNGDVNRAIQEPEVRARLSQNGMELFGGTPEQFGEFQRAEIAKWTRVVKEGNVRAD